jgi:hypothetical protein
VTQRIEFNGQGKKIVLKIGKRAGVDKERGRYKGKEMSSLGAVLKDLARTNVGIRVFVAPCTARTTPDFGTHADYALVSQEKCY